MTYKVVCEGCDEIIYKKLTGSGTTLYFNTDHICKKETQEFNKFSAWHLENHEERMEYLKVQTDNIYKILNKIEVEKVANELGDNIEDKIVTGNIADLYKSVDVLAKQIIEIEKKLLKVEEIKRWINMC